MVRTRDCFSLFVRVLTMGPCHHVTGNDDKPDGITATSFLECISINSTPNFMASKGGASASDIDADVLYSRATIAEHERDFDAAFRLYLSAAQAYLHRAKSLPAQRETDRSKCKSSAGSCLERAERIKATRRDTLKPLVRDPFSKGESRQASRLEKRRKN